MTSSPSRNTEPSTTNPKGPDMCGLYPIPTEPGNIKITPEMAKHWLEHHRHPERQRRYSDASARRWARAMLAGRWQERSPQGIDFDWDGFCINGQHRLGAIVLTGLTLEMFVHPNVDPAVFTSLDQGIGRRADQIMRGPHTKARTAAARILLVITDPSKAGGQGVNTNNRLESDELLEADEAWPELREFVAPVQNVYRYSKISVPTHLAIIAQAARTRYADRIPSWFDGLINGVGLDAGDPRLHLRNRFSRDGSILTIARHQRICYNLIAKAWNAHAMHRPVGVLKSSDAEGVVRVIG